MSIRWSLAALTLALGAITPLLIGAQTAASAADSARHATAIIERAVTAHGGIEALRAARHLRVTMRGHDVHRMQSLRVDPPYDRTLRTHDFTFDLDRGRLLVTQTRGYPGGFVRTTRFITDGANGYAVDMRARMYSRSEFPPAEDQLGNLFYLPQFRLLVAVEDTAPHRRRALGVRRLSSGTTVTAVRIALPNGAETTLGFDPRTHHLRAVMSTGPDPLLGDADVETEFLDYRMLDGVLLPERWVTRRGGEVIADLAITAAAPGWQVPDSLLAPPPGFADAATQPGAAGPSSDPMRELAPGVWALQAGGSWSLLVAFNDHLLVVDAPPRNAREVISRAAQLAPGKPIRYVVPTHHHDDHFAGVRDYAAVGATTVTTPGNADFFRRIVSAPSSARQSNQAPPTPAARLETISGGRRVFTDGSRTVEIHDIGPSPHAQEMLIAWLPAEGIVFQGDLVDTPNTGVALRGANSETTMHFAGWLRRQGWHVRTIGGTHAMLPSPSVLDEIVKQPVLPPE